jgi:hypothetical protein
MPVDKRSIAWLIARSFLVRALAVKVAAVFVLITVILIIPFWIHLDSFSKSVADIFWSKFPLLNVSTPRKKSLVIN